MYATRQRSITVITQPATEPVSPAEAAAQCKVDGGLDAALLASLVTVARQHVEGVLSRALITQTIETVFDEWPCESVLYVPRPPLVSVTSIKYKDTTGAEATWASSNYIVDTDAEPGRVGLIYSGLWPQTVLQPVAGIRIRFVAGYGAAENVPGPIKQAILLVVSHLYDNRDTMELGRGLVLVELPTVNRLLAPYKMHHFE